MSPGSRLWEMKFMMGKQERREECPLVAIMGTSAGGCNNPSLHSKNTFFPDRNMWICVSTSFSTSQ